ncbi:hypothetical protein [Compostimonas suwonensis]|uniref:Uncharacterized protein n=1 Tax=Compostimonas suwonensis TaxID=1048394 RepID=A0A2M9C4P4_9MICO|nr:hypothetical protein [Compostimonas suwonensis]PJJ65437.1 hypothetical protein CLV54_0470 [Compostimonas suwonensis]
MKWKIPAATAAAFALVVVAAPAAHAAATDCTTELSNTTVGELTVPAGETCVLGAVTVEGSITVGEDAWLDATDAVIEGDVIGTDAYGILIDGTSVAGDVVSYSAGTRNGFLYLYDLAVGGSVEAGGIDVEISDSAISGGLSTLAANYVTVLRTTVGTDAEIADSDYGVDVSGAIITGSLSVTGSSRDVLIGATADGAPAQWGNTVGGDVTLAGNSGNLRLAGSTVGGTITLDANTPAAGFGSGNSAAAVVGDFTGTPAAPAADGDQSVAVIVPAPRPGELSWSLEGTGSLVDLGIAQEQGDHFSATGSLVPVRVTDTRIDAPSWSVSAQLSDFVAGDQTVSGKYLGWTPVLLENDGGAVAGAAIASGFTQGDGLSVARTLGSADAGHVRGSAVLGAELDLKLPLSVGQGTYNATLTLTGLS